MKEVEHILYKSSQEVSMSEKEMGNIRAELKRTMLASPFVPQAIPSPFMYKSFIFVRRHTVSVAIVTILFFSGGISVFADKALPGSPLFGIKTGVNEKVLGWFATTPYAKAQLAVNLAERRITEAEAIESNPNVSNQVKQSHQALLDSQLKIADDATKSLAGVNTSPTPADNLSPAALASQESAGNIAPSAPLRTSSISEDKQTRIKNLREKLDSLRKNVDSSSGTPGNRNNDLRTKVRLVTAQKFLLDASLHNSSTTDDDINSAEEIISSVGGFISKHGGINGQGGSEIRLAPNANIKNSTDNNLQTTPPKSSFAPVPNVITPSTNRHTENDFNGQESSVRGEE